MSKPMPLELHIDRLTLASLPPGGERRLRRAVEVELTRLLATKSQYPRGPAGSPAGPGRGASEQSTALEIAATIHRTLANLPTR